MHQVWRSTKYIVRYRLSILFFFLILTACSSQPTEEVNSVVNTVTFTLRPTQTVLLEETQALSLKVSLTSSVTSAPARRPKPTITSTMITPPIPIATQYAVATLQVLIDECGEFGTDYSQAEISPDGMWFAISCGYKRNQKLIVKSQKGTKWLFDFANFINPELEGMSGDFMPLAWSEDGRFLYFTKVLGWDGGGNQCFEGYGVYGLYRLHLRTGSLITLVSSDDMFPGNKIRFSPNNEQFAVDKDGIKITNLISDEVTAIDTSGVMEMIWSPDGKYLAFSEAKCDDDILESSSISVWDSTTGQTKELFTTNAMVLRPNSWSDISILRFEGEKIEGNKQYYTIFEYDLEEGGIILSGTATPSP